MDQLGRIDLLNPRSCLGFPSIPSTDGRAGLSIARSSGAGWLERVEVPVEGGRVPLLL